MSLELGRCGRIYAGDLNALRQREKIQDKAGNTFTIEPKGKEKTMKNRERRQFRRAAKTAARRAVKDKTITRVQRGAFVRKLHDDNACDEMADVCLDQAVKCGLITPKAAAKGDHDWPGFGENIDWPKFAAFIKSIITMFIAL